MDNRNVIFVASVAAALAAMACGSKGSAPETTSAQQGALVKCEGINECKGQSECQGSEGKNGCQGLNECKAQGWISVPSEDCANKGGKVIGGPPAANDGGPGGPLDGAVATKSLKCDGINECKGLGSCTGEGHACKGQNDCKGHGWVEVPSEEACMSKGGKLIS